MRFTFVVERWIEGRHAITKRLFRAAPNASALHLALGLCVEPLRALLATDDMETMPALGQQC
eukprot:6548897-Lingulodinium_polyedra.AAC.1